jgi:hypothetical protein
VKYSKKSKKITSIFFYFFFKTDWCFKLSHPIAPGYYRKDLESARKCLLTLGSTMDSQALSVTTITFQQHSGTFKCFLELPQPSKSIIAYQHLTIHKIPVSILIYHGHSRTFTDNQHRPTTFRYLQVLPRNSTFYSLDFSDHLSH